MSRWEIQIALLISAGVVAISIPPASAVESVPGVALAVLETLPCLLYTSDAADE